MSDGIVALPPPTCSGVVVVTVVVVVVVVVVVAVGCVSMLNLCCSGPHT